MDTNAEILYFMLQLIDKSTQTEYIQSHLSMSLNARTLRNQETFYKLTFAQH